MRKKKGLAVGKENNWFLAADLSKNDNRYPNDNAIM